jgi:hypothetical protein
MTETPPPETSTTAPALKFNWEDWLPFFEASDATLAEKRACIEVIWMVVVGFVDLGFDLNPTQQTCGKEIDLTAILQAAVVNAESVTQLARELPDTGKEDAA